MKIKENNKGFGLLFFSVFLILSLWPLLDDKKINYYFLIIALTFLILGLLNTRLLTPLKKAWIKLGEILGRIIAPLVMGIIYFFLLTPLSFIVRIVGKDLLNLKFSSKTNTYWIKRIKKMGTMNKQF